MDTSHKYFLETIQSYIYFIHNTYPDTMHAVSYIHQLKNISKNVLESVDLTDNPILIFETAILKSDYNFSILHDFYVQQYHQHQVLNSICISEKDVNELICKIEKLKLDSDQTVCEMVCEQMTSEKIIAEKDNSDTNPSSIISTTHYFATPDIDMSVTFSSPVYSVFLKKNFIPNNTTIVVDGLNFFAALLKFVTNRQHELGFMHLDRTEAEIHFDSETDIVRCLDLTTRFFDKNIPSGSEIILS